MDICQSCVKDLIDRLRDEADLCRAETADDTARLLDEAADALEALRAISCASCGTKIEKPMCVLCLREVTQRL